MGKFNSNYINLFNISEDKETRLWENAILVFDSSALLDFYSIPKITRKKIYDEIFKKLANRLWLPFQVQYEYLKNRESVLKKPIGEKYSPLKKDVKDINGIIKTELLMKIGKIGLNTQKDNNHPHIKQNHIELYKQTIEKFLSDSEKLEKDVLAQIDEACNDILDIEKDDDILKALEKYFDVGREFSFDEIINITKDGKHRYEFKIPPGYGDYLEKEKKGTQIFGDLILWKQILEFSRDKKLPIILITNDIKKDQDWCYLDKKPNENRILKPREELIKEIYDFSNVEFWMYNLPQFLFFANKHLKSSIKEESIEDISKSILATNKKLITLSIIEMIVFSWLKKEYPSTDIIIFPEFPTFLLEQDNKIKGIGVKYLSKMDEFSSAITDLYYSSINEINFGSLNSFIGIIVSNDFVEANKIFNQIKTYQIVLKNKSISFISGYVNEKREFEPILK